MRTMIALAFAAGIALVSNGAVAQMKGGGGGKTGASQTTNKSSSNRSVSGASNKTGAKPSSQRKGW
jgi:hypothetical protein